MVTVHVAALEEQLAGPIETGLATTDLAIRHQQGVGTLLAHRDDLRSAHALTDMVEESVRWSA